MHPAIIIGTVRSLIVDVAMGQIPRSTERISSIGGQFNERLLLWQPFGIFLYSTVIFICFMLCRKIKYDDDDDCTAMTIKQTA